MFPRPAARVKGRHTDAQSSPNTGGDPGAAAGPSDAAKAADALAEPRAAGRAAASLELEAIPAPEPGD